MISAVRTYTDGNVDSKHDGARAPDLEKTTSSQAQKPEAYKSSKWPSVLRNIPGFQRPENRAGWAWGKAYCFSNET